MTKEKWQFIKDHWKLGTHLVLHTKHFGVNNDWWFNGDSFFGESTPRMLFNIVCVYPLIRNYKDMKHRAIYLGFMHPDQVRVFWGKHPWFDK